MNYKVDSSAKLHIRDFLFRETVSCPLKLSFIQQEEFNENRDDLFRRKTKRMLREAVAQLYGDVSYTSNRTAEAVEETNRWMQHYRVVICGAALKLGEIHTRIPILVKDGIYLNIVQVHGKLAKNDPEDIFSAPPGKSPNRYLLMAAYRRYVLQKKYPEARTTCSFMFPRKSFRADFEYLYQQTVGKHDIDEESLHQLKELFAVVDGTDHVREMSKSIAGNISHRSFTGRSVAEALDQMVNIHETGGTEYVTDVHQGCKDCSYRKTAPGGEKGCWDIHFPDSDIKYSGKHQFDLIGHHVENENLHQQRYHEQIDDSKYLNSSAKVMDHTRDKIAIYHRKAMQILEAKDEPLPLIFGKKMLRKLDSVAYPVHFLDFEAASHPVPLQIGARPYDTVLFQFSCHTLQSSGRLLHSQWLDQHPISDVLTELTASLADIPGIERGTIVQYSPFERQSLYRLYREMREKRQECAKEVDTLEKILHVKGGDSGKRFLDLSKLIRDGYYNKFMTKGLGLKEVLMSVIKTESLMGLISDTAFTVSDSQIELTQKTNDGHLIDPYEQLSDDRSRIRDGVTAMHAYLCMKSVTLSEEQAARVPVLMKRYCTMDTLALYYIFRHLLTLIETDQGSGDVLIRQ
ncbi:MAG: DUF2779 domain-containing protein [Bacteroidetes bacterium]|nr:DUF2779 domain-containing protein [Bacteroidota bacterium]